MQLDDPCGRAAERRVDRRRSRSAAAARPKALERGPAAEQPEHLCLGQRALENGERLARGEIEQRPQRRGDRQAVDADDVAGLPGGDGVDAKTGGVIAAVAWRP
jgi:hypothetical protein